MSQYPENIYDGRDRENKPGFDFDPGNKQVVYAEDAINWDDEIAAVQTELGTIPKAGFGSVKKRLSSMIPQDPSAFRLNCDVETDDGWIKTGAVSFADCGRLFVTAQAWLTQYSTANIVIPWIPTILAPKAGFHFRTQIAISFEGTTQARLGMFDPGDDPVEWGIGFRFYNNKLYGFTAWNADLVEIELLPSVSSEKMYILEMRIDTEDKLDFYVDGVFKGQVTLQEAMTTFFGFALYETKATVGTEQISFLINSLQIIATQ